MLWFTIYYLSLKIQQFKILKIFFTLIYQFTIIAYFLRVPGDI